MIAHSSKQRIGIFIGGMRCGSTAFRDYFRQHPQVCMHKKKDPHFFSGDDNWNKGIESYLRGWTNYNPRNHSIAVESSTHYTKLPLYAKTADRMASLMFDFRLVYGVRDPIDRVESHLLHNAGKGYFDPRNNAARARSLKQAIKVSRYRMQLASFEKYFPPTKIIVFTTEDFVRKPKAVLVKVSDFFEIDCTFEFDLFERRERKFKHGSDFRLNEHEEALVCETLIEDTRRFVDAYELDVSSWRIFK